MKILYGIGLVVAWFAGAAWMSRVMHAEEKIYVEDAGDIFSMN